MNRPELNSITIILFGKIWEFLDREYVKLLGLRVSDFTRSQTVFTPNDS